MSNPTAETSDEFEPGDDDDVIPSGIEAAAVGFTEAGLLMPPVPRELADAVEELDDMEFGTGVVDLTDRADWLRRASDPAAPAEVAFGQIGHGVASYALYYQLITDALAVFVRQPFGSVYGDAEAERAAFNDVVEQLEELVVMTGIAKTQGRIGPGQRLIVAVDDDGSGWQLVPGAWQGSATPVRDGMTAALASRPPPN